MGWKWLWLWLWLWLRCGCGCGCGYCCGCGVLKSVWVVVVTAGDLCDWCSGPRPSHHSLLWVGMEVAVAVAVVHPSQLGLVVVVTAGVLVTFVTDGGTGGGTGGFYWWLVWLVMTFVLLVLICVTGDGIYAFGEDLCDWYYLCCWCARWFVWLLIFVLLVVSCFSGNMCAIRGRLCDW